MASRQSILLVVLSALMALPAGIAAAGEMDIRNGNVRVMVSSEGDVTVLKSTPSPKTIYSHRQPSSRVWIEQKVNGKTVQTIQTTPCKGRTITQRSTYSNRSGTATNRVYSSTTTCF
jgi:frataxin-like iron-binding protein CyaY